MKISKCVFATGVCLVSAMSAPAIVSPVPVPTVPPTARVHAEAGIENVVGAQTLRAAVPISTERDRLREAAEKADIQHFAGLDSAGNILSSGPSPALSVIGATRVVKRNLRDLEALKRMIDSRVMDLIRSEDIQIGAYGIDQDNNTAFIEVVNLRSEQGVRLKQLFGSDILVTSVDRRAERRSRPSDSTPRQGGA